MILDYCDVIPKVHTIPQFDMKSTTEWHGVKAIWYEGASYHGLKTKVFALVGYPEIKENEKVPAIVLVHGGGGHPYAEWIRRLEITRFTAVIVPFGWIGRHRVPESAEMFFLTINQRISS